MSKDELKLINTEVEPYTDFLERKENGSWAGLNSYNKAKSDYHKELLATVEQMVEVETTLSKLNAKMITLDRSFRLAKSGVKENNENTVNARRAKSASNSIKKLETEIRNASEKKYEIEAKLRELNDKHPDILIGKKVIELKRYGKYVPSNLSNNTKKSTFYAKRVLHQGGTRKRRSYF